MAYPGFSIIALALVGMVALLAVGGSVAVWRIRSLAAVYRCALSAVVAVVVAAGLGWIVFVRRPRREERRGGNHAARAEEARR
jgi:hypothetical protein